MVLTISSSSEPTARTMKLLLPSCVKLMTEIGEIGVYGPSALRPWPVVRMDPGLMSPPFDGPAPGGTAEDGRVGAGGFTAGAGLAGAGLAGAVLGAALEPWSPWIRPSTTVAIIARSVAVFSEEVPSGWIRLMATTTLPRRNAYTQLQTGGVACPAMNRASPCTQVGQARTSYPFCRKKPSVSLRATAAPWAEPASPIPIWR